MLDIKKLKKIKEESLVSMRPDMDYVYMQVYKEKISKESLILVANKLEAIKQRVVKLIAVYVYLEEPNEVSHNALYPYIKGDLDE